MCQLLKILNCELIFKFFRVNQEAKNTFLQEELHLLMTKMTFALTAWDTEIVKAAFRGWYATSITRKRVRFLVN